MAVATQYPSPFPSYTEQYLDGSSSTDDILLVTHALPIRMNTQGVTAGNHARTAALQHQNAAHSPSFGRDENSTTRQPFTTTALVHGSVSPQSMAYWTGGPSANVTPLAMPSVHPPTNEDDRTDYSHPPVIHRVGQQENYMLTNMGSSLVVPSSSPLGSTDSSMQVFQQNFGSGFAFYDSVPGAGMPEGFYAATREAADISALGMLGQMELRKATKKQPAVDPSADDKIGKGAPQEESIQSAAGVARPRVEKKRFFPCC